jgi:Legume lectin domain/FG-GAP-like repeat/Bacterial Ig-like domain (group 3)
MSAFRLLFRFLIFAMLPLSFLTGPLYGATPAVTSTVLMVSPSSVPSGGIITLTATVTAGGKAVSPGQVLFCDAEVEPCSQVTAIGYAQLVTNGTATIRAIVPTHVHSIAALFTGTATSGMSVSPSQAVDVSQAQSPTFTSISSVPGDFNQSPFVTATVAGGASPPGGELSFVDTQHGNAVVASPPLLSGPYNLTLAQRQYGSLCNCTPTGIVTADFNRDGYPDIAFVGADNTTGNDTVTILTGRPNGTLSFTSSAVLKHGGYASIAASDLNNDGIPDLAVVTGEASTCILLGKGNGSFAPAPCVPTQTYGSGITLGDVTSDGNIDLLIGAEYGIAIYPGNGDGTFRTALPIDGNFTGYDILLTDLNGDGILDAVTSGLEVFAYLGKGDGTFTYTFEYAFAANIPSTTPAVADFNGDGILDIAFLGEKGVFIATGLGNGTFARESSIPSEPFLPPVALSGGNFNNDGFADIYLIHCSAQPTTPSEDYFCDTGQTYSSDLYLSDGKGNFTSVPGPAFGTQPPPAVLASFDNRGLPQVVYVTQTGAPFVASFLPYSTTTAPSLTVPQDTYLAAVFPGDASHLSSSAGIYFEGSPFSFANGFPAAPSGLFLNGGAQVSGSALRLTDGGRNERRGVFSSRRVGISSFYTSFDFHLTGAGGAPPMADGFTFVLQGDGPDALGAAGAGLGYGPSSPVSTGPAIDHSLAIKFDLHSNAGEGSSSTGFYLNGTIPTVPADNLLSDFIDLHSGDVFHVIVTYDGSSLELQVSDPTTGAFYRNGTAVNLTQLLGGETAYVGFTAATGSGSAMQDILNWTFTAPSTIPRQIVDIDDAFYNSSRLILNGGSSVSQGALLISALSPSTASSAYFVQQAPTSRFATDFDFNVGSGNGQGFTFVIQSQGSDATGSPGGGLGYGPPLPSASTSRIANSVGVKFDLQNNDGEGSNSAGVYLDGASPTLPAVNLNSSGINLHSGHTFHARLTYDGTNLTEVITDLTQYAVFTKSFPVDIPAAVGTAKAYVGFTAGTGIASADPIKLLNWSLTSSF